MRGRASIWIAIAAAVAWIALAGNASEVPADSPTSHTFPFGNHAIHFVDTGETDLPTVIFVHGTPGSWDNFGRYFHSEKLRGKVRMISVDRPGFGESASVPLVTDLKTQAAALSPLLKLNQSEKKTILVGHSLGGPIIARMAMDFPDEIDGIFMIAPTIDPTLERTKWYQSLGRMKLIRWMVPEGLDRANQELKGFRHELEAMLPHWPKITAQAIVLQGGKDKLVDPGNAAFAQSVLPEDQVDIWFRPELNHFIPWTSPDLVVDGILELAAPNAKRKGQ